MRTRNKQHEDPTTPPRSLSDRSKDGVGKLLSRISSRRSTGKKKEDNHLPWPDHAITSEEGSEEQYSQNTDVRPSSNADTPGTSFPQEKGIENSVSCVLPGKTEDTCEMEWEDGFIPMPYSGDNCQKGVVVEFYDSPSSSKKKTIRRASPEDKELAELVHKVHLLCLVARGRLVDRACNDPLIQAALLSLLPSYFLKIADVPNVTADVVAPLIRWFHENFRVECSDLSERSFESRLTFALESRRGTAEEVAALSVALFRALNLTARFVSILDVAPLKPAIDTSESPSQDAKWADSGIFDSSTLMVTKSRQVSVSPVCSPSQKLGFKDKISYSKGTMLDTPASTHIEHSEACQTKAEGSKRKGDLEFDLQLEMAVFATAAGSHKSKLISESKDLPSPSSYVSSYSNKLKRIKNEDASVNSHGISTAVGSKKVGASLYWAEVFCSGENSTGKWVHVDAVNLIIGGEDKVDAATSACKRTLRYVVAFAGNGAKDVTRRYCTKWYTIASKRIKSQWWDAVLAPLKELESRATGGVVPMDVQPGTVPNEQEMVKASRDSQSSLEDMELQIRALTEPLPTNQQAYRNHHLYAIERWLNKYEILYPKGPTLGYCSGHAVYPRTCVQILQTKQRWLREGLQIKANESPAKVLKHFSKHSKAQTSEPDVCKEADDEGTFSLYGKWQTEPLDLPHARNGIVPKNERGQVDVWSEKCLPHGTVHLRLPRVVPVAKRLEIDFARAMVGFEFRNGRSVPIFEGIVICSEFKDAIIEAYTEEEEKREAEEKKHNEAQATLRWYQLISSMITRQRLNDTYGDASTSEVPSQPLNRNESGGKPESSSYGEGRRKFVSRPDLRALTEDHEHIFPVEDQSFDEESSVRTKRCPCGFLVQVEEF
ncbi:Dna repair protein rad4 [Thalictrum thalictroides]|uniref:Dna repair protein rad4 n=1 Tax=Thalictrum thalictroides TaxID=46969 RepID=A0A7J6V940_THATH|nr:Dna repair protein rad4 [Thalictrum thalictroides]